MSTAQLGDDDTYVLSVSGELDLHTTPRIRKELDAVVQGGGRYVVVDLRDVGFVDTTMLATLVEALRQLRAVHGELVVVSDDPRILRPFGIAGLDRLLRIEDSLSAALN